MLGIHPALTNMIIAHLQILTSLEAHLLDQERKITLFLYSLSAPTHNH